MVLYIMADMLTLKKWGCWVSTRSGWLLELLPELTKTTTKDVETTIRKFPVMFAIFCQGLEGIFGAKLMQNFNTSALHISMSSTSNIDLFMIFTIFALHISMS